MKARTRSISGAVTAVLIIPFIIGLLACLPVPIGDPERSRIDDDLSGIWLELDEDGEARVTLFEPYDKRTWLVTTFGLDIDEDEQCAGDEDPKGHAEVMAALRDMGKACLGTNDWYSYKAWRKKLGNTWFMTWELKGAFDVEREFEPDMWLGFGIEKESADEFVLRMIDIDAEWFAEFEKSKAYSALDEQDYPRDPRVLRTARREFERVLKRNADNEDIYAESPVVFSYVRIRPENYDLFVGSVVPDSSEWFQ